MAIAGEVVKLGVGMVVKNSAGVVMMSTCNVISSGVVAPMGEATALRYGLLLAKKVGFSKLIEVDDFMLGLLIKYILHLAQRFTSLSFSFIRRAGNSVE